MPHFSWTEEGELTAKQKQKLATIKKIVAAFYDGGCNKQRRTWKELLGITKLSNGVLSKHLNELISQGIVKGTKAQNENGRLQTFYEYTNKSYRVKGRRNVKIKEVIHVVESPEGFQAYRGHRKKGKGNSWYFV